MRRARTGGRLAFRPPTTRTASYATLAVVAAAGSVALIAESDQESGLQAALAAVVAVLVGWAYVGSGLVAWRHRMESRLGPVMVFIGLTWFLTFLAYSDSSLWFTVGTATDSDRHRIHRDLHDGAQQRLVSIAMALALAESKLTKDPHAVGAVLQEARQGLIEAMEELRELSQGIRPAILVERGPAAALDDLGRRSPVPVRLDVRLDRASPLSHSSAR